MCIPKTVGCILFAQTWRSYNLKGDAIPTTQVLTYPAEAAIQQQLINKCGRRSGWVGEGVVSFVVTTSPASDLPVRRAALIFRLLLLDVLAPSTAAHGRLPGHSLFTRCCSCGLSVPCWVRRTAPTGLPAVQGRAKCLA